MAYVVLGYGPSAEDSRTMEATRVALQRAIERDGRFTATIPLVSFARRTRHLPQGWQFNVERVRLPYCGAHPGPCAVPFGGPRKMASHKYLEWDDWVAFHALVNDVLDRLEVTVDAWTNPRELLSTGSKMWIRRDNQRRVRFDWTEQYRGGISRPFQVWNAGTPDQFRPESDGPFDYATGGAR